MVAMDLISDVIPALKTSDTGLTALSWMEIFRISHLPIVNNREFLGLISDSDIYDLNSAEEPIGNHRLSLISPFVLSSVHIFEVMGLAAKMKLSVVPVLDEEKNYQGMISRTDLLDMFAKMSSLHEPGGLIVVELHENDLFLSQIAQIVESNDAKILSMYVSSPPNSTRLQVTLKLNKKNLQSILQTFERYDYTVTAFFHEDDEMDHFYSDRYEMFMRYLNM